MRDKKFNIKNKVTMIETAILIAIGWFGHKYKDPIVKTVKNMVGK